MFNSIEEINEYIEWEAVLIVDEPECCCMCHEPLKDEAGWDQYYLIEDFTFDKFCSENCVRQYLIENNLKRE